MLCVEVQHTLCGGALIDVIHDTFENRTREFPRQISSLLSNRGAVFHNESGKKKQNISSGETASTGHQTTPPLPPHGTPHDHGNPSSLLGKVVHLKIRLSSNHKASEGVG